MNELYELNALIVETMKNLEEDDTVTMEFKDGAYNIMFLVESFIKQKLEDYIEKAMRQYEDSKAKA